MTLNTSELLASKFPTAPAPIAPKGYPKAPRRGRRSASGRNRWGRLTLHIIAPCPTHKPPWTVGALHVTTHTAWAGFGSARFFSIPPNQRRISRGAGISQGLSPPFWISVFSWLVSSLRGAKVFARSRPDRGTLRLFESAEVFPSLRPEPLPKIYQGAPCPHTD